jgi:hypothetical protein
VVAAKSLLAAALLALACAAAAVADDPSVRIRSADQARAVRALLRQTDFGVGWRGGRTTATKLTSPSCPGFNPKESDLIVTGHAEAKFAFQQSGVTVNQDVQVLVNEGAVRKDFSRTIRPPLAGCLAYQLRKASNVTGVTVKRITFPAVGTTSAAYRATIVVQGANGPGKLLSDYVFFGEGRLEYAFNVIAPVGAGDQLVRFESALAEILLRRAGATPA